MTMRPGKFGRERGAALVEYALLMALLVVVSLGVIQNMEDDGGSKVASRSNSIGEPTESNDLPSGGTTLPTTPPPTTPPSGPITIHVGELSGSTATPQANWTATVTITVRDADGDPVQGATVTGEWSVPGGGTTCSPTDADGQCSITSVAMKRTGTGSVPSITFTIVSLAGTDMTYDPDSSTLTVTINNPG